MEKGSATGRPGRTPHLKLRTALQCEGSGKSPSEGWQCCNQRNEKEIAVGKVIQGRFCGTWKLPRCGEPKKKGRNRRCQIFNPGLLVGSVGGGYDIGKLRFLYEYMIFHD